ncbi:MAG: hypothetical protein M9942_15090 [Microthrixaceae bacterium]|nr:hypothetical protein [Microthrixaceae bacterium]
MSDDQPQQEAASNPQADGDPQAAAEATDSDMLEGVSGSDDDVRSDVPPDRPTVLDIDQPPGDSEGELDGPGARRGMRLVDPADSDVDSVDDESDSVATQAAAGDLSPEEGAVHPTADPPMGHDGDGYI